MRQKQIKINDLKVTYKETGSGEPVLILHGWGSNSSKWVPTARLLKNQGYKIIIPDLPGFGNSQEPKNTWKLQDYATFIKNFTKKIEIKRYHLAGHSFGGRIAIKLASQNNSDIKKLFLISAAGIPHSKSSRQKIASITASIGSSILGLPGFKMIKKPLKKLVYKIAGTYDYQKASKKMKEIMKEIINEDLTPLLAQINPPTLLIWGREDKMTPLQDAELMLKKIPDSRLEIIDNVGHGIHLKKEKKLAAIINSFLD